MQNGLKFEPDILIGEVATPAHSGSGKGQIYTRPAVVEFMLTAIGLNTTDDFNNVRILEPACGEGEFVVAIAARLINLSKIRPAVTQLMDKILAVELVNSSLEMAKQKVAALLEAKGYSNIEVMSLLNNWFRSTDFLLADITANFTHVIGNPPYVRVENIPRKLLCEYRRRFSTMTDRADLYIPFYQKSLSLLQDGGKLSFICTDRWTKNIYGKALRQLISENYSLELFIDLYGVAAFEKDVMTYPAISQILKAKQQRTILKHGTNFSPKEAKEVLCAINGEATSLQVRKGIVNDNQPWLLGSADQMALIRKLEAQFPLLEDAGCKVYIGAATGANKVYIVDAEQIGSQIEENRLVPVVAANELKSGTIAWRGKYLINTYDKNGVINLHDYPKLASYLNSHKDALCQRHVAKKDSAKWFKTIDRVYEERAKMAKLLIPDISSDPIALYDAGNYHPNNSIYYVCSKEWNLHALRVILLSNVTKLFISTYNTKIAKGYLRFQAQHLRKLRVPNWDSIDAPLRERLVLAGQGGNVDAYTDLTCEVYHLNKAEKLMVNI